jgi:hypothetical protein
MANVEKTNHQMTNLYTVNSGKPPAGWLDEGREPLSVRSSAKRVKRGTGTILGFSLPRRPLFGAERSSAISAIFADVGAAHPRFSELFHGNHFPETSVSAKAGNRTPLPKNQLVVSTASARCLEVSYAPFSASSRICPRTRKCI